MPYWRLSLFYGFYFASLGAFLPYWPLYLEHLGHDPQAIGLLMALLVGTKIIAPNVWAWIADHSSRRMGVVRVGATAAALLFAGVFWGSSFAWLAAVILAFSFFWNAVLPQFEVVTLNHLGEAPQRYTRIRLWGSVGFVTTVAGVGPLLDGWGTQLVPGVVFLLLLGIAFSAAWVPERVAAAGGGQAGALGEVLRRPEVVALILVCFLLQASHGPYYTFYSIYLDRHGYSHGAIGALWALGVVAEVGVFLVMHRLVPRFGLRWLMLVALGLSVLRWLLIGQFVESLILLIVAQCLHAASFGLYHGVAIQLFHRFFRGRHQGRGQALYSSLSFGAGGAVGALYSGYAWEALGPAWTFSGAASLAGLALVVAWVGLRDASAAVEAP
ncbi:MAG TPA: MFS transporter [Gammaproteobacteria bacterium]|nr:MFS transporter [Gammaproteobacteria bacterium]